MNVHSLQEWVPTPIALSQVSAAALHARPGRDFQVEPSWAGDAEFVVTARGVVGSVALPDCALVVRPKVELNVAVHMLSQVLGACLHVPDLSEREVPVGTTDLNSVVAAWFCRVARPVVERRLARRYEAFEETLRVVRGRIDIPASMRRSFRSAPPTLTCRFDEFTPDIVENRTLLAASVILSGNPALPMTVRGGLRRIESALADVKLQAPPRWQRQSITLDRLTSSYRRPLALADWILDRASPELREAALSRPFQSFLIAMHRIFEKHVFLRLSSLLAQSAQVREQDEQFIDVGELFRTIPDITVASNRLQPPVILDTKYKAYDEAYDPAESDIYQMITYCVTRGSREGVLVYPEKRGGQAQRRYEIPSVPVTITTFPLVLGNGPGALDASLDDLARFVTARLQASH